VASYGKILKYLNSSDRPIYSSEDLRGVPSIGKSTLEKVDVIAKRGTHPLYEEVIHDPQYKILTLFQTVRGIGPARAYALYQEGHRTIADLKRMAAANSDFSASDPNLAASLQYYDELSRRIPRKEITSFTRYLNTIIPKKLRVTLVNSGSYRMGKKDSGDVDLLVVFPTSVAARAGYKEIIRALEGEGNEEGVMLHFYNKSAKKINGIVRNPRTAVQRIYQMDMLFISKEELPWYLLYFGSGKEFSKKIRTIAIQKGYKLNERGLYYASSKKRVPFHPKEEREIFDFLETPYVKPEKR
jgi:DNA polymerase/3'-5' exonuclease PolX